MTTILIILAGILVTGLLAYAIVNYIPRKLHWIVSIILIGLAALLVYKINFEIRKPIKFNKEKKERYAKVISNLKIIRDAEVAHKKVTGTYTANGEDLIKFIDTAKFALTQTRNVPKTINVGGGITKEIEERVVDTIGYEDVRTQFVGTNYKNMMQIPGTDQKFKIEVGFIEKIAGLKAPVFEVKVDKALILKGMDINLVKQEKEAIGGEEIRGEYVRVGSLGEVSEDGNWPPFYDKGDKKDNE
ncbi:MULTISPECIES: hypothetical protein [Flavobacteriaceae]|uniref:Uncharacterized protein n=2 Tax=Flavobacteriaceae TaxID=49546 RepID=A0A4Y8AYP4_9FLAO|nr:MULTISPECIES: hypothetical protein [Flavobacteriaceae]TEW77002.1 hypothetical protein E2488_03890 [Gramella jeungdoensis]GGK58702.1 hypothetical protein GCM10007963_28520 [Lutibacter litoralis]